jgi:hypothetical protein
MPLQKSGTIDMNDIRTELGVPTQAPFSMNTARSGGYVTLNTTYSPTLPPSTGTVSLSSWYGYCQTCNGYIQIDGAGYACVDPDTQIQITPSLSKTAKDLKEGELIYTQHEKTLKWGYFKILRMFNSEQPKLKITTYNGELICSLSHVMYVSGEYKQVEFLKVGETLLKDNTEVEIISIEILESGSVIDFTIEDAHTYITNGFLSHNKDGQLYGWGDSATACSSGPTANDIGLYFISPLAISYPVYPQSNYEPYVTSGVYDFYYNATSGEWIQLARYGSAGNYTYYVADMGSCTTYYYYYADRNIYCSYDSNYWVIRTTNFTLSAGDWICGYDGYQYYITSTTTGTYYDTEWASGPQTSCYSLGC